LTYKPYLWSVTTLFLWRQNNTSGQLPVMPSGYLEKDLIISRSRVTLTPLLVDSSPLAHALERNRETPKKKNPPKGFRIYQKDRGTFYTATFTSKISPRTGGKAPEKLLSWEPFGWILPGGNVTLGAYRSSGIAELVIEGPKEV